MRAMVAGIAALVLLIGPALSTTIAGIDFLGFPEANTTYVEGSQSGVKSLPFVCSSANAVLCAQLSCTATATSIAQPGGFFQLLGPSATLAQLVLPANQVFDPVRNSWSSTAILRLQVTDDAISQALRHVVVNVSCTSGGLSQAGFVNVTVLDDDVTPTNVEFGVGQTAISANEGETVQVIVSSTGLSSQVTLSVSYQIQFTTANALDVGGGTSGTVEIPAGQTSTPISIPIADDIFLEGAESFLVLLTGVSPSTYGRVGLSNMSTVTIRPSDQLLEVFRFDGSASVTAVEGTTANFIVTRRQQTAGTTTVRWTVTNASTGLAVPTGTGLSPVSALVTFLPGESAHNVSISIVQDGVAEVTQIFRIALAVVSATAGHPAVISTIAGSATLTVPANGFAGGAIGVDTSSAAVTGVENGRLGHVSVDFRRDGGAAGAVLVRWRIARSIATLDRTAIQSDFGLQQGAVVMESGEFQITVTITVTDDDIPEQDEVYYLVIWMVAGNDVVIDSARRYAQLTITQNDDPNGVVGFASPIVLAHELIGHNPVALTLLRTRGAFGIIAVHWRLANATTHGNDIAFGPTETVSGSVTFGSLQTVQTLVLSVLPDTLTEPAEEVVVELFAVDGGGRVNASSSQVTVVVQPNDDAISFSTSTATVSEGEDAVLTITRSGVALGPVIAQIMVAGGSATPVADFTPPTVAAVHFDANVSEVVLRIPIIDDTEAEGDESFSVTITNISAGNAIVGAVPAIVVTITSNDGASGVFGFSNSATSVVPIREGGRHTFLIVRNLTDVFGTGLGIVPATLSWEVVSLATPPRDPSTDFVQFRGILDFDNGVAALPLELQVIDDSVPEVLHAYTLNLVNPSADGRLCQVLCDPRRTVTVPANDEPHGIYSFQSGLTVSPNGGANRVVQANVTRSGGAIGNVDVLVSAVFNGSGTVFVNNNANIRFMDGQSGQQIVSFTINDQEMLFIDGMFALTIGSTTVAGTYGDILENGVAAISSPVSVAGTVPPTAVGGVVSLTSTHFLILSEPSTGVRNTTLGITRTGGTFGGVTVRWIVTAAPPPTNTIDDADFATRSGVVSLTHGQSDAPHSLFLSVLADSLPEFNESFGVALIRVDRGVASIDTTRSTVTGVILENDNPYGIVQFEFANFSGEESVGVLRVNVVRSNGGLGVSLWEWRLTTGASGVSPATQFVSISGTVRLNTGDLRAPIFLQVIDDNVPELSQDFVMTLEPLNAREDLGSQSTTIVTIEENDDAHGRFSFSALTDLFVMEGTAEDTIINLPISRTRGLFGNVTIAFIVTRLAGSTGSVVADLAPAAGNVVLPDGSNAGTIQLRVQQDTFLENAETFSVTMSIASGSDGAVEPGQVQRNVVILHNDDPIQFGPNSRPLVTVNESDGQVILMVTRGGNATGLSTVSWRADVINPIDGVASPFSASTLSNRITFPADVREVPLAINLTVDSAPQPHRFFRVTLTPALPGIGAGYVVPSNSIAIVTVLTNNGQDANGTTVYAGGSFGFSADTTIPLRVSENSGLFQLPVARSGGAFSNVRVLWRTTVTCSSEFTPSQGAISFPPGVITGFINTTVVDDNVPERLRSCLFELYDIEYLEPEATAPETVIATGFTRLWFVEIAPNDGIFGVYNMGGPLTLDLSEDDFALNSASVVINRAVGFAGTVRAVWSVRASTAPIVPPATVDFLLTGLSQGSFISSAGRVESILPAYNFDGLRTSFILDGGALISQTQLNRNWTIAFRILQRAGNSGYLWGIWAGSETSPEVVATVQSFTASVGNVLTFSYRSTLGRSTSVLFRYPQPIDAQWTHIAISREVHSDLNAYYTAYVDGIPVSTSSPQGPIDSVVGQRVSFLGRARDNIPVNFFNGMIQEAQLYTPQLNTVQIAELAVPAAASDVLPVTGQTTFEVNQQSGNFTLTAVNDGIPEVDEAFTVNLLHVGDGGLLGSPLSTPLVIARSDNPNGRFVVVTQNVTVEEGSIADIEIRRLDGDLGIVNVSWTISICRVCDLSTQPPCVSCPAGSISRDLSAVSGVVQFGSGQRSGHILIEALADGQIEFNEEFVLNLVSVTGGGRLDSIQGSSTITVAQNGFPYGQVLLQRIGAGSGRSFAVDEGDSLTFNVIRHGRTHGNIAVDYEVVLGTANGGDIVPLHGNVTLADGQSQAQFSVTVVDDSIPELNETFSVRLPPTHQQSGLAEVDSTTVLTTINFTIRENDVPYGVFSFTNRSITIDESDVAEFIVEREFGLLSPASVNWRFVGVNTTGQLNVTTGTLFYAVDQRYATLAVSPREDGDQPERSRRFAVVLFDPTGGATINAPTSNAILTLTSENDPHGIFSIASVQDVYPEPSSTPRTIEFLISRAGGSFGRVNVAYLTLPGTASPNQDYTHAGTTVQFAEGEVRKSIFITLLPDTNPEVDETAFVRIVNVAVVPDDSEAPFPPGTTSPRIAGGADQVASFTIRENDFVHGVFYVTPSALQGVSEGTSSQFTVHRAAGSVGVVELFWVAPGVGNFTPTDINQTSGTLTFGRGETVKTVPFAITDDGLPEIDEPFSISLTVASQINSTLAAVGSREIPGSQPVTVGGSSSANFTILQNDDANGVFLFDSRALSRVVDEPSEVAGSHRVDLLITRQAGAFGTASVRCHLLNQTVDVASTPSGGAAMLTSPVTFVEAQRSAACTFYVRPDTIPELEETFLVQLTDVSANARISNVNATSSVLVRANDDPFGSFGFESLSVVISEPSATEQPGDELEVGEADDASGNAPIGPTAPRTIRVLRSGGAFGSATVMYRTRSLTGTDLLRDLGAQANFLDDPAPTTDSLLFRIFDTPLGGKLSGAGIVPLVRLTNTRGVQGCLLACALESRCVSLNVRVNGSAGLRNECELLTLATSPSLPLVTTFIEWAYYEVRADRAAIEQQELAIATVDYTNVSSGIVRFASGQTVGHVTIDVVRDDLPELQESFAVDLFSPVSDLRSQGMTYVQSPSLGNQSSIRANIAENDNPYGIVLIDPTASTEAVDEADGAQIRLTLIRTAGRFGTIDVRWIAQHPVGHDISGSRDGIVRFLPGERIKTVTFDVINDAIPERNETITFGLVPASNNAGVTVAAHNVTILANDMVNGEFGFASSVLSLVLHEPVATALSRVALPIIRRVSTVGDVTVAWTLSGPNAAAQFNATSGLVVFADGDQNAPLDLWLRRDSVPEVRSEFQVTLSIIASSDGQAFINALRAQSTLTEAASDDPYGVFSFVPPATASAEESAGVVPIAVLREFGVNGHVSVAFRIDGGTATAADDFVNASGVVVFEDGQTSAFVNVSIVDDTVPELDEWFTVTLLGATLLSSQPQDGQFPRLLSSGSLVTNVTISRNDFPFGLVSFNDSFVALAEGQSRSLTLNRARGTFGSLVVTVTARFCPNAGFPSLCNGEHPAVAESDAMWAASNDTMFRSTDVLFAAGQSQARFDISAVDDSVPELAELFFIEITSVGQATIGNHGVTVIQIEENDEPHGSVAFGSLNPMLSAREGETATFTLVRSGGTFGAADVRLNITDTDDSPANGLTAPSLVQFRAGQRSANFDVVIFDDDVPEINQTVRIAISECLGTRCTLPQVAFLVVLENDDPHGIPILSNRPVSVTEDDGYASVSVSRSRGSFGTLSVQWSLAGSPVVRQINNTTQFFSTPVQDNLPFADGFAALGQSQRDVVSVTNGSHSGHALHYSIIQDDLIYTGTSRGITGEAVDSVTIGQTQYFATAARTTGTVFTVENGVARQVQQIVQPCRGVLAFSQSNIPYFLFVNDNGTSSLLSSDGSGVHVVQNLTLPSGATSASTLNDADSVTQSPTISVIVTGTTGATAVLRLESNGLLRLVYQVQTRPSQSWVHVSEVGGGILVGTSASHGVALYRFVGGQLERVGVPELVPSTPLRDLVRTSFNGTFFVGRTVDGENPVLLEVTATSITERTLTIVQNGRSDAVFVYEGTNGEVRLVTCDQVQARCTVFRVDPLPVGANVAGSSGWITFPENVAQSNIRIGIINDNIPELAQDLVVVISAYEPGGTIATPQNVTVTILQNDDPFGSLQFTAANLSSFHTEQNVTQQLRYIVERQGGTLSPGLVSWQVSPQTNDILPHAGTVSFAVGQTFAHFDIGLVSDNHPELSEVFQVMLSDVQLGPSINNDRSVASLTILGNDAVHGNFHFATGTDRFVSEDGGNTIEFTILRSGGLIGDVAVHFSTRVPHFSGRTDAVPNVDYRILNGTVVIPNGVSTSAFNLTILDDDIPEDNKWLTVSLDRAELLNASGVLFDSSGEVPTVTFPRSANVVIIANDDASGVLEFRHAVVVDAVEGSNVVLSVDRTRGLFGSLEVALALTLGSASPSDIQLPISSNISFAPFQNSSDFVVGIVADGLPELSEGFTVAISAISGGLDTSPPRLGVIDRIDVTIPENDDIRGVLSVSGGPSGGGLAEGDRFQLNVSRLISAVGPISFTWQLVPVTAAFTSFDVSPSSGTVDFGDGNNAALLVFTVVTDGLPEGLEQFTINLQPAAGSLGRWDGQAPTLSIAANENGNGFFEFASDSLSVLESSAGVQTVSLNVTRGVGAFGSVSVDWQINLCTDFGCANVSDLAVDQPLTGTVIFSPNETHRVIDLFVGNDDIPEFDEHFNISLALSAGQVVSAAVNPSRSTSIVTISRNDDGQGVFGFASNSALRVISETNGPEVVLRVLRHVAQLGRVHVIWEVNTANGSLANGDFETVTGSLDFADGVLEANITLRILDDNVPELAEDFTVILRTREVGIGRIQTGSRAIVRIPANDNPLGTFSIPSLPGSRISNARTDSGLLTGIRVLNFTAQRSGGVLGDVAVSFGITYTARSPFVASANAAAVASLCSGTRCIITVPAGTRSQVVGLDLPQGFILGVGDTFAISILSVNSSLPLGTAGPSVDSGQASTTTVVSSADGDALVGFVGSAPLVTSEGALEQISISRQTSRGSLVLNWAVSGTDVSPSQGTLSFADGEATKTIALQILDDGIPELNETYRLQIVDAQSNDTLVVSGVQNREIQIVANDDPYGVFQIADGFNRLTVDEGGQVQVTLDRSGGLFGAVDLTFNLTSAGGLVHGVDYRVLSSTAIRNADGTFIVQFSAGQASANVVIAIPTDTTPELAQILTFRLVDFVQSALMLPPPVIRGLTVSTITISESNSPRGIFRMAQTTLSVSESDGSVILLVQRTGGAIGRVTCSFSTSPSTGRLPSNALNTNVDFLDVSGTLVFEDGIREQNISIRIVDDSIPEQNETFVVVLTAAGNGATIDALSASAAVTILANDNPAGVIDFTSSTFSVDEGVVLSIPVSRTPGAFGQTSVRWQVRTRTGSDFILADVGQGQGVLSFAEDQTTANILIPILEDNQPEVRETFDVVLLDPSTGASLGANSRITVTINENGDPHGQIGFSCISKYGGRNANGQGDDTVVLEIIRSGGTIGAVSVAVGTTLTGTASSSEVDHFNRTVFLQSGQDRQTVTLTTHALTNPLVSKTVVVAISSPTGGALVNTSASESEVTIYATPFTAEVLSRVQGAVCSLQAPTAAATRTTNVLNQVEYDAYVRGIHDLTFGSIVGLPVVQTVIDSLFAVVLNAALIGPDVRNNRGVPELLIDYGKLRSTNLGSTCSNSTSYIRIGTFATVEVITKGSPSDYNGLQLFSDSQATVRHAAQLPLQVYSSPPQCAVLAHVTYFSSAAFRTSGRSSGTSTAATVADTIGFEVLQGTVVSVALDGLAERSPMSVNNPVRFAVEYDPSRVADADASCVRWAPLLDGGNGAWTTADCQQANNPSLALRLGFAISCECTSLDAQHLAVLVPDQDDSTTAVAAIDQLGFVVLLCAAFSLIVVYFCCHKDRLETTNVQMVMQFIVALFGTQFFVIISSNASEDASEGGSQALGILLHFFFVAQFTWVCAICYYLYTEFMLRSTSVINGPSRFWELSVGAWGGAATVTIVYLVSDLGARGNIDEVFGWARNDRSFSLIPKKNDGGIYGSLGGPMILATLAVACCVLRLICTPDNMWLGNDDLFQNRSNRSEIKILFGLFLLHLTNSVFFLVFVYEEGTVIKLLLLLICIVEAVYIFYFYAFTTNVRKSIAGPKSEPHPPHLTPLNDLISMRNPAFDPHHAPAERVGYTMSSPNESFASNREAGYLDVSDHAAPASPGMSRVALSAGFQTGPATASPYMSSSDAHTQIAEAHRELSETKAVVHSPYTGEDEFDDLIYTLQASTFEGGDDSTSQQSIDLDAPVSPQFRHKRVSIMDTHL